MADQIVITEKTSQAKDVRAAVGARYGDILPAEGHLIDLLEPEEVVPEWKRWSAILLQARRSVRHATCGRRQQGRQAGRHSRGLAHGQAGLAGDGLRSRGPADRPGDPRALQVSRRGVCESCSPPRIPQTIRDAFSQAKPNTEYARLYAAAVARRQADQIYNLSLTRTATVILGQGARGVIGVGRVKTPTLAIVCRRELEIRNFVPVTYFEVVATATVAGGDFKMRHAPQERILRREMAQDVAEAAHDFEGTLGVRVEDKRQGSAQGFMTCPRCRSCASRFGWSASKTLEVAQELYDGQGKKIITYPRAEVRYLPENLIADVPKHRGRTAGRPILQDHSRTRSADHPSGQAVRSTTRGSKAPAITPSSPTSTPSIPCAKSGRACRSTRRGCSM